MNENTINIAILGKTGVGKSSFCNYIFGDEVFKTGRGKPVTGWESHFTSNIVEYDQFKLKLYDSVGIEADNLIHWKKELKNFMDYHSPKSKRPPAEWLHSAVYMFNASSGRVEDAEISLLKEIKEFNVPVHIVLTNCDAASKEKIKSMTSIIKNNCNYSAYPN